MKFTEKAMNNERVFAAIEKVGIIPVVVINRADHAVSTAEAINNGGIPILEITLRTDASLDAIKNIASAYPDMPVGAGTVITLRAAQESVAAGAKFIVSPGFSEDIVRWCIKQGVIVFPGCATPTEIMRALSLGIDIVKFFPSEVYGGLDAIRAFAPPFSGVRFIPTGGIDRSNLAAYLKLSNVYAIGGSWLCTQSDIDSGKFEQITALCKEARIMSDTIRRQM
jgi:2-dehydro-3-deoxyphosphogluconate aldolase/(4S)-4-hydroxy-2-oxoglutarate aldolase